MFPAVSVQPSFAESDAPRAAPMRSWAAPLCGGQESRRRRAFGRSGALVCSAKEPADLARDLQVLAGVDQH